MIYLDAITDGEDSVVGATWRDIPALPRWEKLEHDLP